MRLNNIHIILKYYIQKMLLSNKHYNWHVFSRHLSNIWQKEVERHYSMQVSQGNRTNSSSGRKTVIAMYNGWIESGGWADRLKGIISTYILCKENGWNFKILYVHPFHLEQYIGMGTYDWYIAEEDVVYVRPYAEPIALETGSDSTFHARKQKEWLKKKIEQSSAEQVHVYTNAMFAYYEDYGKAFHELFRLSDKMEKKMQELTQTLGNGYVSISARFLNALGDFNDTVQVEPLPAKERKMLIENCIKQIRLIHNEYPDRTILVNSDSSAFLEATKALPYTRRISGNIVHFDTAERHDYETFEKTFIDFFLISRAASIYRLKTKWMHNTGFPYAASLINKTPFHSIVFNLE